jgi:hypothetical protein
MNVPEFIEEYSGRPHKDINCYELVQAFYKEVLNIELPEKIIKYDEFENVENLIKSESKNWQEIEEPEKFCVITMKQHPIFINHVAVYLGNSKFLHSTIHKGVSIDSFDSHYKPRIKNYYKYM